MSSFASSSYQSKLTFEYDVFLTFFNVLEDGIRTLLETCLIDAGFKTLIVDIVNDSMREMIPRCRIVVVVITPEFVRSDVCLERLATIMSDPKTVVPFFYGVNHNEVRVQLKSFYLRTLGKQLIRFTSDFQRTADAVRSSLCGGFTLSDDFSDQEVLNNLIAKALSQVGVQAHVKEVLHQLGWWHHEETTTIVGIWGVGGIGKTTIVRDIYDTIGGQFNCRSFLANIKHVWENNNGQVLLQKQLISDIQENHMKQGTYKGALIVLDDVNQVGQLTELCGNKEQFSKGSLIFITTRNKGLLDDFVDVSYEVGKLGDSESLQLFGWHAFKNFGPTNDFVNLSIKVTALCKGLPLVLEVIGSLLHNKTKSEWKKILNKLEKVSTDQIQRLLKISLDFLDDAEKKLFCDIACLLVGRSKSYVTHLFKGSGFPIEMGMQVLVDHCLVKIVNDKIDVHDLLKEIGRGVTTNTQKLTYIYDVFLSFRGEDTRKSFATHLYNALKQARIEVFMDEEKIARGEHISGSLLRAIENSRISIVIFSQNYAGSSWCLRELEKIMECYKTTDQEVFPIFYDVQPSEVRKQQNAFGKAWERLVTTFPMSKAKKLAINLKRVLSEAANLSG